MVKTFIYVLKDPISNEVRYVGKSNNPNKRFSSHLDTSKDIGTHKRNWINKLLSDNQKPILEIIDEVDIDNWSYYEKKYIDYYINKGCNLVNCGLGGEGLTYGNQTSFKKGHNTKKIVLFDKNGILTNISDSIKDAEKFIGKRGVSSVLSGKTKKCGGYICVYENDYLKMSSIELCNLIEFSNLNNGLDNGKKTRFVKNTKPWNTGKKYESFKKRKVVYQYDKITKKLIKEWSGIIEISNELGLDYKSINNNLRNKSKSSCGFIWSYEKRPT